MRLRPLLTGLAAGLLAACSGGTVPAGDTVARQGQAGVLTIEAKALATRLESGEAIQLIDVRTREEFAAGHLAGAINIPLDQFDPSTLPTARGERVLYCRSGRRSAEAAQRLAAASGRNAVHLDGGILAWEDGGHPVTR